MKQKAFRWICDTSSLIYLEKTGLLNEFCSFSKVLIPLSVYQEWRVKSKKTLKMISILVSKCRHNRNQFADNDVLKWGIVKKDFFLLSEDRKIFKRCIEKEITIYNSLRIPSFLYKHDRLKLNRAESVFFSLTQIGFYSRDIIRWAENELTFLIAEKEREQEWERKYL